MSIGKVIDVYHTLTNVSDDFAFGAKTAMRHSFQTLKFKGKNFNNTNEGLVKLSTENCTKYDMEILAVYSDCSNKKNHATHQLLLLLSQLDASTKLALT